eukprot:Lithocolla_globosa_v1_NODE_7709_length_910_cov_95.619883.p2 type:complete len:132 gc:universal NODE_7709_length_910_cov_95.619883:79-474(+)
MPTVLAFAIPFRHSLTVVPDPTVVLLCIGMARLYQDSKKLGLKNMVEYIIPFFIVSGSRLVTMLEGVADTIFELEDSHGQNAKGVKCVERKIFDCLILQEIQPIWNLGPHGRFSVAHITKLALDLFVDELF